MPENDPTSNPTSSASTRNALGHGETVCMRKDGRSGVEIRGYKRLSNIGKLTLYR
jgi:hypothetical protein